MSKIKTQVTAHAGKVVEQREHSSKLVEVQTCAITLEINCNWAILWKIWNNSAPSPTYTTPGYIIKGPPPIPQGHLLNCVHWNFTGNSTNVEITYMSPNQRLEKELVYLYNGMLFSY